jgi:YHS domain-containing protein
MASRAIALALALAMVAAGASSLAAAPAKRHSAPAQAVCPMDGKVVNTRTAPSMMYKGQRYWFDSRACLAAFKKDPAKALNRQVTCAACGMKMPLRSAQIAIYKGKAIYACTADCKRMIQKNPGKYTLPKQ